MGSPGRAALCAVFEGTPIWAAWRFAAGDYSSPGATEMAALLVPFAGMISLLWGVELASGKLFITLP